MNRDYSTLLGDIIETSMKGFWFLLFYVEH